MDEKEEEWSSYTFLPSNESNSLTPTLFDCPPCLPKEDECYVPMDSLEIPLFEEIDACYTYNHDSPIKHHPNSKKTKKTCLIMGLERS